MCLRQTFCGKCNSKTNALNFIKLDIQLHPDLNVYRLLVDIGEEVVLLIFFQTFVILKSQCLLHMTQKFMYEMLTIKNNINSICTFIAHKGVLLSIFL